jgi:hypothetical protein
MDRVSRGMRPGSRALAVRVWLCRIDLDRDLAQGANPTTDPARGLRAQQLLERRHRRRLAACLRWLVDQARRPQRSPWAVAVPSDRRQVAEAGDLLLVLADRLEDVEDPCPRSAALASFLVSDPLSPVHLLSDESDRLEANGHATTAQLARAALEAIDDRPLR